jgi:hypothetical protein
MTPKQVALKCAELCEERKGFHSGDYFARQIREFAETLAEDRVLMPRKLTSAIAGALENTDGGNIATGLLDYWQPVWDAVLLAAGREDE